MTDSIALKSFCADLRVVVIGAAGGVGGAVVELLTAHSRVSRIYALTHSREAITHPKVAALRFDLQDETSIAAAAQKCRADGLLHLVIVATGVLHAGAELQPEKSWRSMNSESMARAFAINTIGPALCAKHFLDALSRTDKSVFAALSARVGSIEDNRLGGWHSYRASKAALHMVIRTCAVELSRRNPAALCIALHPGTVDTLLSKPFQGNVPEGQLFTPRTSAEHLLRVIDALDVSASGNAFAWDGQRIPF